MITTINIHADIMNIITSAAMENKISRAEMVILLIKSVMNDMPHSACMGRLVKYQKRSDPENWHTLHVKLRIDDYEYFLDLRKILKMSISLILAYAAQKYLNNTNKFKVMDNYQYKHYTITNVIIEGIPSWIFTWGIPSTLPRNLRLCI